MWKDISLKGFSVYRSPQIQDFPLCVNLSQPLLQIHNTIRFLNSTNTYPVFFWVFFVFFKYVNNRILPPVLILFRFLMDIFFLTKEDRRSFQILVNPIFDNFTIFMKRHSGVAVSLILMSLGVTFTPLLPLHSYTSLFPNPTNPKTQ